MNNHLKILILLISALSILSCRGGTSSSASSGASSSDDTTGGGSTGVVDNTVGFKITVGPTSDYTYTIHEGDGSITDDFTAPCEIDQSFSSTDIKCVIEAKELDLFFFGAKITMNVPKDMCDYVTVTRPYYYNFIPGAGPTVVIDNRLSSTDVTIGAITATAGTLKVGNDTKTSVACDYNYSLTGGPNCCTGKYDQFTTDAAGVISTTLENAWGGLYSNCLSGPAMQSDAFGRFAASGYPLPILANVSTTGINTSYTVSSPLSLGLASNIYAANYFNPAEHGNTGGVPACMASPNGAPATNQYHEFRCFDRAAGVLGRIRVMIRDWDLDSEYELGVAGDPDTGLNTFEDLFNLGDVSAASGDSTSIPEEIGE